MEKFCNVFICVIFQLHLFYCVRTASNKLYSELTVDNLNETSETMNTKSMVTEAETMNTKSMVAEAETILHDGFVTTEFYTSLNDKITTVNSNDNNRHSVATTGSNSDNLTLGVLQKNYPTTKRDPLKSVYNELLYAQDMYVIPLICPVGIIGNCLVARNLFSRRKANSSFIYMVFILLADILSLVSDVFLPIARLLQLSDYDAVYSAAVFMYFWNADVISFLFRRFSLNIFCVLSYERLVAITRPLKLYRSITVTHSYVFIILSFLVASLATVVTPLFTKMTPKYDMVSNSTTYVHTYTDIYANNQESLGDVMIVARFLDGPLQIIFFSIINGMIIYSLYKNKNSSALENNTGRTKVISQLQTRLCKIFLVLSFTNMLAFLPNAIIIIIAKLFPETGLSIRSYGMKIIMFGGNILRVINSITDFIIFLVMSKDIREDIKKKICCLKKDNTLSQVYSTYSINTVEEKY